MNDYENHTIRIAASICLKNLVKDNWNGGFNDIDRLLIKNCVMELVFKSFGTTRCQLIDTIAYIALVEFPDKWPGLADQLVEKLYYNDLHFNNTALEIIHHILKHYRYELITQNLCEGLKYVAEKFAQPLTELLLTIVNLVVTIENVFIFSESTFRLLYGSLVLITKIFFTLNAQELLEFFEDNLVTWIHAFNALLTTDILCLHTAVSVI